MKEEGVCQSVHCTPMERVPSRGCAIICEAREIKIRLPKQMSNFNPEAVAILEAIKATRRWRVALS
jgi:hypothetical protein